MIVQNKNIPRGWKSVLIPEVLFFQEGPGVRNWQFSDAGVKLLNGGNINDNKIDLSSTKIHITEKEAYGKYSHFLIDEGDLLIACSGIVVSNFQNKIAFIEKGHLPLCLNTSTMRFKSLDTSVLDLNYFKYYLQTKCFTDQLQRLITGSAQLNFGPSHIKKIEILIPPLNQQKKIAAILDAADTYRQKTKALISKYDELLKSIIYRCVGNAISKDIKTIKAGTHDYLPEGFKWVLLEEVCDEIADIDHKMPKDVEKGRIFLSAKDLSDNGEIDFSNPKLISEDDYIHLSRKIKPQRNDIIYSRIGAKLGKARLVKTDMDFIVSYSCCTIRPKHEIVSALFLRYVLDSNITLRQASHGTKSIGVPDLGMNEIRNFLIPYPKQQISRKIENELQTLEAQKAQAQQSLNKAEELFNSLLQKAFKGELA